MRPYQQRVGQAMAQRRGADVILQHHQADARMARDAQAGAQVDQPPARIA
jgi:hypothetical protein